jgi:hypothetical protein
MRRPGFLSVHFGRWNSSSGKGVSKGHSSSTVLNRRGHLALYQRSVSRTPRRP